MTSLAEALAWLAAHTRLLPHEIVPAHTAAGRVLALPLPIAARPPRALAAIDGLAVRAATTQGASDYAPAPVTGTPVRAGDPMPPNADAVLPPALVDHDSAPLAPAALAPVAAGDGVIPPGHDAPPGCVLPAGTLLGPVHLALLHGPVAVIRRPRVALDTALDDAGPMLHALAAVEGAVVDAASPDLILGAGRNPGAALTTVFTRSIAVRPGEAAIIGLAGATPALHLPGPPLDVATLFALLAAPALQRMGGRAAPEPIPAQLTRKVTSTLGQRDAIRVRLAHGQATPLGPAESCGLALGATANGLILVPEGCEGYPSGTTLAVHPLPP